MFDQMKLTNYLRETQMELCVVNSNFNSPVPTKTLINGFWDIPQNQLFSKLSQSPGFLHADFIPIDDCCRLKLLLFYQLPMAAIFFYFIFSLGTYLDLLFQQQWLGLFIITAHDYQDISNQHKNILNICQYCVVISTILILIIHAGHRYYIIKSHRKLFAAYNPYWYRQLKHEDDANQLKLSFVIDCCYSLVLVVYTLFVPSLCFTWIFCGYIIL